MRRTLHIAAVFLLASAAVRADDVDDLSEVIARLEGWGRAGSLVRRLHNPGALAYARQRHANAADQGYARFRNDADGWAALRRDLAKKIRRGLTIDQIARRWSANPDRYSGKIQRFFPQSFSAP